jgi:hypothetical protein
VAIQLAPTKVVASVLVLAACSALVLKIFIALATYGSTDVLLFEADLATLQQTDGVTLYRDGIRTAWCGNVGQQSCPPFNHPPFVINVLNTWVALAPISGLPFRFWLRVTCALADLGTLVLLANLPRSRLLESRTPASVFILAASPIAILLSGFHGNTDSIMIFFVLLSVYLIETERSPWAAGIALGVAASIKVVPVLLIPAILAFLPGRRRRLEFSASMVVTWLAGAAPVVFLAPELVFTRVFGYKSQVGTWGLSLLARATDVVLGTTWLASTYEPLGRLLSLGLVFVASVWPRPRPEQGALLLRVGFLMFLLVAAAPGFGVQYLAWLVPWVVAVGLAATLAYYLTGSAFLIAYYTAAAGTFPWFLANSLSRPAWNGTVLGLGFLCWITVCGISLILARRQYGSTRIVADAR